jgi:TPR repeat protein
VRPAASVRARQLVVERLRRAFEWMRRAAEEGHPDALYNVAMALQQGRGVAANTAAAVEW